MTTQIARKETRCHHKGYSFRLAARVLLYASFHRQDSTYHGLCYTSRGALAGTRNSSAGPTVNLLSSLSIVRWVVGSILHGVELGYFSFQPVLHDWCYKGCGMCYPVCGMVHIKEPLLLIRKSSLCGGSRLPFSL